jgi:hypothetical protein
MEPGGNLAANCCGIAVMPLAGRALSPSARQLKTKSNSLEVVWRSLSKKIPPKKGRKKLSMMESEKPIFLNKSMVGSSFEVRRSWWDLVRTRMMVEATRSLSRREPIGFRREVRESEK